MTHEVRGEEDDVLNQGNQKYDEGRYRRQHLLRYRSSIRILGEEHEDQMQLKLKHRLKDNLEEGVVNSYRMDHMKYCSFASKITLFCKDVNINKVSRINRRFIHADFFGILLEYLLETICKCSNRCQS